MGDNLKKIAKPFRGLKAAAVTNNRSQAPKGSVRLAGDNTQMKKPQTPATTLKELLVGIDEMRKLTEETRATREGEPVGRERLKPVPNKKRPGLGAHLLKFADDVEFERNPLPSRDVDF
jgi:hypothetical protein